MRRLRPRHPANLAADLAPDPAARQLAAGSLASGPTPGSEAASEQRQPRWTGWSAVWRSWRLPLPGRLSSLDDRAAGDRDEHQPGHGRRQGTTPLRAREAELAAYARWRTGETIKVTFGITVQAGWAEDIQLSRPAPAQGYEAGFAAAELELEHLLMHHRHGWREAALLWHVLAQPAEPIPLPWAPWDNAGLRGTVMRLALSHAVPALTLPRGVDAWRQRWRDASRWIAAAWADGAHRELELAERPGLADRLPLPVLQRQPGRQRGPSLSSRPGTWSSVLYGLATRDDAMAGALPASAQAAVDRLVRVEAADLSGHIAGVLHLTEVLAQANALPASHTQRPAWLYPTWGRWRAQAQLREALDRLLRSPATSGLVTATTAARTGNHALRSPPALSRPGDSGLEARRPRPEEFEADTAGRQGSSHRKLSSWPDPETLPDGNTDGGRPLSLEQQQPGQAQPGHEQPEEELPEVTRSDPAGGRPHTQTVSSSARRGAGPGVLGALQLVHASAEDRAAYWQLRGALAPEIAQLIARLQAVHEATDWRPPQRFQRAGRLDRHRLPGALAGREDVFVRHVQQPTEARALCLLLDCSASMAPHAEQLRLAAILVETAAAAFKTRVSAFTLGAAWERMEPETQGAPLLALGRELHPHGGTPFGPAVAAAAGWLERQPFRHKQLWVLSDGQWSARDQAESAWQAELLRDTVVWVLDEHAPPPPTPAMCILAAPTLASLVKLAPDYFWTASATTSGTARSPAALAAMRFAATDAK